MKLNTSFAKFKKLHKSKKNQTIAYSEYCKNYRFVENLYKFILVKKNIVQLDRIITFAFLMYTMA